MREYGFGGPAPPAENGIPNEPTCDGTAPATVLETQPVSGLCLGLEYVISMMTHLKLGKRPWVSRV
ncbi:MAG: hypothetical protein Kow0040_32170 [Thermogutta sp.]